MEDNNIPRNGKSFKQLKKQEAASEALQKGKNRRKQVRVGEEKYVSRVEQFAQKKLGIETPQMPQEKELKAKLGKETVTDKDKADHNWKVYGSGVERDKKTNSPVFSSEQKAQWEKEGKAKGIKTERKPNIEIKPDGTPSVSHMGSKKSLRHEVAHIYRAKKGLVSLAQAMDSGFGKIKQQGMNAAKEAEESGKSKTEIKQAAKQSNQFAHPGEYETQGVENWLARRMGVSAEDKKVTKHVRHPFAGKTDPRTGKKVKEDKVLQVPKTAKDPVQTAMDKKNMGKPIHAVIPSEDKKGRHISHLSSNISPQLAEHLDQIDRGELTYDHEKGWVPGTSIHARINARAREKSKDPTRKDAKTLMRSLDALASSLETLGKSETAKAVRDLIDLCSNGEKTPTDPTDNK